MLLGAHLRGPLFAGRSGHVDDREVPGDFPDLPRDALSAQRALQVHIGDERLVFGDTAQRMIWQSRPANMRPRTL